MSFEDPDFLRLKVIIDDTEVFDEGGFRVLQKSGVFEARFYSSEKWNLWCDLLAPDESVHSFLYHEEDGTFHPAPPIDWSKSKSELKPVPNKLALLAQFNLSPGNLKFMLPATVKMTSVGYHEGNVIEDATDPETKERMKDLLEEKKRLEQAIEANFSTALDLELGEVVLEIRDIKEKVAASIEQGDEQ